MFTARLAGVVSLAVMLSACQSAPTMPTAKSVDLPRFMGAWYVIAYIPTYLESDAYNAVESYTLEPDGTIVTTFTFNKGSLDGERKVMTPHGFVVPGTKQRGVGHAVRVADQGRVPDRPRGRELHRDHHRPLQARLRVDHGAHARPARGRLRSASSPRSRASATT